MNDFPFDDDEYEEDEEIVVQSLAESSIFCFRYEDVYNDRFLFAAVEIVVPLNDQLMQNVEAVRILTEADSHGIAYQGQLLDNGDVCLQVLVGYPTVEEAIEAASRCNRDTIWDSITEQMIPVMREARYDG